MSQCVVIDANRIFSDLIAGTGNLRRNIAISSHGVEHYALHETRFQRFGILCARFLGLKPKAAMKRAVGAGELCCK